MRREEVIQKEEPKEKLLEVFKDFKLELRTSKGQDPYKVYYLRTFKPKNDKIDYKKLRSIVRSLQRKHKNYGYCLEKQGDFLVFRAKKVKALDMPIYFNTKENKVYVREEDTKANPRLLSYVLFRMLNQIMSLDFVETRIT
jgi:hypothetical protein